MKKLTDIVILMIVVDGGFGFGQRMKRESAMWFIKGFFSMRDEAMKGDEEARLLMENGTLAYGGTDPDNGEFPDQWAFRWRSIIGMYIKEDVIDSQAKAADASARIANAIEKEMRRGDEWRGEDDA